ncbi:MAG: hypothetical protein QM804_06930 [Propionicimonas sp.]
MKKLLSLLAATGLVAGSLLATTIPAQADDIVDVTAAGPIVVKDFAVSSKGCKVIPMSIRITTEPVAATFDYIEAWVAVWNGKTTPEKAEVEVLYASDSNRVLANTPIPGYEQLRWCPTKTKRNDGIPGYNLTGLGTFYAEGTYLQWWNTLDDEDPNGEAEVDTGRTTFTVKQAAKVSSAKISKKGTKRTISAKFSYFDVAKKKSKAMPKKTKIQLQRSVPGTNTWKTIKTVKTNSKGAVKTTYKTKTTYEYRFVYTGSSTKAPVTSKTLRK